MCVVIRALLVLHSNGFIKPIYEEITVVGSCAIPCLISSDPHKRHKGLGTCLGEKLNEIDMFVNLETTCT